MAYSTGILRYRVTVYNKVIPTQADFGSTTKYEPATCVWADVTWKKGAKSLNIGALDSVDTVLIRMRWNGLVTSESQLECEGVRYQIQSFHADRHENTIQITATEIIKS